MGEGFSYLVHLQKPKCFSFPLHYHFLAQAARPGSGAKQSYEEPNFKKNVLGLILKAK